MTNPVITNNDLGSVAHKNCEFGDETLNLSGAQTVAEGRILARDSVSGKLTQFYIGGSAVKATSDAPFNLAPGDTAVIDVDNVGNATTTFDAAAASILDTTVYTGGTAASITDTTTYAVADQDGLTSIITVNGTAQTVTFSGATTTAAAVAAQMAAQLTGVSVAVVGGQVVITTDLVGVGASLSAAAGTGALTWAAPVAGGGGLADQDGLTSVVTLSGGPWDGVAQTVTFSGVTATAAAIASQMNASLDGCSVDVSGGQVRIVHDGAGTDMDIAVAAGTGALTWAASTAGTGDVADINAVTAAEVAARINADTTATATVSGSAVSIKATTELDFISGLALAKLGLSVETITANENGIPKFVLGYELEGSNGDNVIRAIKSGVVRKEKLNIVDGSTVTNAVLDQLKGYSIVAESVDEQNIQDNQ